MNALLLVNVCLVIFAVGTTVSGCLIVAIFSRPRMIIKSRIDLITCILVFVSFVWAACRTVIQALIGYGQISLMNKAVAGFSNVMLVGIFWLNLLLALERWLQIRGSKDAAIIRGSFLSLMILVLVTITAVFVLTPSTDGIRPDTDPERILWIVTTILSYLGSVLFTIVLYVWTYGVTSKQLVDHPSLVTFFIQRQTRDVTEEELYLVRSALERQILFKCLALSGPMIVCYLPMFAYVLTGVFMMAGFDPNGNFLALAVVFMALDTIATPVVAVFVHKHFREALMFWRY
ncbi:hypothetical protein HDU83_006103 [Entophlyctis luteolus]|nr:hypothetical protein HDU83_006103 [Entophlyctis luteolus]KAJ3380824.1 hypothetical protein HDU84_005555 [Entophlyctis sp. JEL0112]